LAKRVAPVESDQRRDGDVAPIAKLLPQTVVHEKVVALVLLLAICFVVGLIVRTQPGQRLGDWVRRYILDRIPGFSLVRGMTRQFVGDKEGRYSNQLW